MSAFIIKVKTDNAGTSNNDQFTLPGNPSYSYNFDVDWGDGSPVETINTGSSWTHTFAGGAGTYSVSITENVAGGFPTIRFNNGGDRLKLLEIEQWGTNRWDTFSLSFYGCSNLTITATDEATADTGGVTNFGSAFYNCSSLTSFPLIDTSSGTSFFQAWRNCSSLTSFPLIDTSSGTNFFRTWRDCSSLTSFPLIDASSGTDFRETWRGCSSLTSFPTLDFRAMSNGTNAFLNVTLDTASYDAILANSFTNNVNNSVTFHGGNSKYARSGLAARDILTAAPRSWTITDGGYDSVYDPLGGVKGWWCPSRDTSGNGTTTLTDLSGNGKNASMVNMDADTVADTDDDTDSDGNQDAWVIEDGLRALRFVSADSAKATTTNPTFGFGTDNFSVACWVKLETVDSGFVSPLIWGHPNLGGATWFGFQKNSSDQWRFVVDDNVALRSVTNGSTVASGVWYHLVGTREYGGDIKFYLNNSLVGTVSDNGNSIANSNYDLLRFGYQLTVNAPFGQEFLNGCLDQVGVWDRVFTDTEVTQLYNGGRSLNLLAGGTSIVPQLLMRRRRLSGGLVI